MVINKIKLLESTKAKVAKLLPRKYGFASTQAFIKALRSVAGKSVVKAGQKIAGKRRKRAVITAATKAKVKELVTAGKTGSEIAKAVGISLPSVQNIKKELGLVKARR
jgi:hypothetical protein